jgi:hypothetical protein
LEQKNRKTKFLVPVAPDSSSGQLRLSSEALQKAIIMATSGGQIENLPSEGLLVGTGSPIKLTIPNNAAHCGGEDQDLSPLKGIWSRGIWPDSPN